MFKATAKPLYHEPRKSCTGASSQNPVILDDDSDTEPNESIYSKFGLSTTLSAETHSIPILPSNPSPRKQSLERSQPNKPIVITEIKTNNVSRPQPSQKLQSSAPFHNAKKPDIRPAERKPVLHRFTQFAAREPPLVRPSDGIIDLTSDSTPNGSHPPVSQPAARLASPTTTTPILPNNAVKPTDHSNHQPGYSSPTPPLYHRVKVLHNGWEIGRTQGRDFFVDHKTRETQWHEPVEATSPSHPRLNTKVSRTPESDRTTQAVESAPSQDDVLSAQHVQQPTPKPSTSVSRTPSPLPNQTPVNFTTQPSSQLSVVIEKWPAIAYESYQDISRKRRPIELHEELATKRLRHYSSSSSSTASPHKLHSFYAYDEDDNRRRKVGQPKVKSVDRTAISLDFGTPISNPNATKRLDLESLVRPETQVQEIHRAQFGNVAGPPITFCNEINGTFLNESFRFISAFRKRPGVLEGSPDGDIVCDCHGDCTSPTCACVNAGDQPYRTRVDGLVVLRDEFVEPPRKAITAETEATLHEGETEDDDQDERPPVIYECNAKCSCGSDCKNRVVQKGRTLPLEIFMTRMCGFGVRCPASVARGQFIDTYLGELMTSEELDDREEVRDTAYPHLASYSFTLDRFKDELNEGREGKLKIPMYQVDATKYGCPTRFVNHSCEPNCRVYPSLIHLMDRRVYNLAFFAIRNIEAYEQLTIDYDPEGAGTIWDENDFADEPDMKRCYCGAPTCRKLLWAPPPNRKRGRPKLYETY